MINTILYSFFLMIKVPLIYGRPSSLKGQYLKNSALRHRDNFKFSGVGYVQKWSFDESGLNYQASAVQTRGGKGLAERSVRPIDNFSNVCVEKIEGDLVAFGENAIPLKLEYSSLKTISNYGKDAVAAHGTFINGKYWTFRNKGWSIEFMNMSDHNSYVRTLDNSYYIHDVVNIGDTMFVALNACTYDVIGMLSGFKSLIESIHIDNTDCVKLQTFDTITKHSKIISIPEIRGPVFHMQAVGKTIYLFEMSEEFQFTNVNDHQFQSTVWKVHLDSKLEPCAVSKLINCGDMPTGNCRICTFINENKLIIADRDNNENVREFDGILEEAHCVGDLVLVLEHKLRSTDSHIIDSATMNSQSVYRLASSVPIGFHGCWVPQ